MKKIYIFSLLLFITSSLFSQIIENFSDNNFTANPEWIGDTQYFIVNPELQLQSNGPEAEYYLNLATQNTLIDETEWRFTVNLDFNPTSSNFIQIHLISNISDFFSKTLNGYYIQIGQTNQDYIKLIRQSASIISPEFTEIATGTTAFSGDINIKIKVTRETGGVWKIYSAPIDSKNYIQEAVITDNTHTSSNYFGFFCGYKTTSRRNQFYFDDIYIGEIVPDIEKPYIQEFTALTKNKVQIKFSELLNDVEALKLSNYTLNGTTNPQLANYNSENNQLVELTFANAFAEEITNTISIENVDDLAGNIMDLASYEFVYSPIKFSEIGVNSSTELVLYFTKEVNPTYINTANFSLEGTINPASAELLNDKNIKLTFAAEFTNNKTYTIDLEPITSQSGDEVSISTINFIYHKPEANDLVINEIMADPSPVVELPSEEYIEIYNRSDYTITLNNWTLTANTSIKNIEHYNLLSGEYLILCKEDAAIEFEAFGNVHALSSFPTLTNSGMSLKLKSGDNTLISRVNYSENWIESDIKRDGGWSIERIDPTNFCGEADNWKEAEDTKGGTPGKVNSILADNPDVSNPEFLRLELINATSIELFFSEIIDFQSTTELSNYSVDNNINSPIEIFTDEDKPYSVTLKFADSFAEGVIYNLTINSNISDCAGNDLIQTDVIRFAIPAKAEALDLIINEVLFNPLPEGSDFIELYNRSEKVIDLKSLLLTNRDENGDLKTRVEIEESHLLFPKEYFVITPDKQNILENYTAENEAAFAENDLPSMSDDEGNIVILNQNLDVIDEFSYSDDMHFALISNDDGISLERIDIEGETNDKSNWHSASQNVGWATPTYENSAYNETPTSDQEFSVTPEVFSPDNDGYDDIVYISYKLEKAGYVANVHIYNSNGILVNRIANNELLGTEGNFKWDGTYNEKEVAKMGIYIIFIELFDLEGNVKKYKKTCVLAKQF